MPKFIICTSPEAGHPQTWIDYEQIAAIEEYYVNLVIYSKIILKSGATVRVQDSADAIQAGIVQHGDDETGGYYVGNSPNHNE